MYGFYLLCRNGPFLGRKSATVSIVRIPATDPLLKLNFPSNPPTLMSTLPTHRGSFPEAPVTATRHALVQPGGTENPESSATNLSILRTKSAGKV